MWLNTNMTFGAFFWEKLGNSRCEWDGEFGKVEATNAISVASTTIVFIFFESFFLVSR